MNYECLPVEFALAPYFYYMENLKKMWQKPIWVIPPKFKIILEYTASHWSFWDDRRFFNTAALILVTGCRISEIPSISIDSWTTGIRVQVFAKKQKVMRTFMVPVRAFERISGHNFMPGMPVLTEREFNRRFHRYFITLKQIAKDKNILPGSHVFRHIFVSTLKGVVGMADSEIAKLMGWSNSDLVLDYTKLLY